MPKLKKKVSKDFTTIHNTMIRDMKSRYTQKWFSQTLSMTNTVNG